MKRRVFGGKANKEDKYVLRQNSRKYAIPYLAWMLISILVPMAMVLYYAFTVDAREGNTALTLEHFQKFFSGNYLEALFNSLLLALVTTVICLAIGYPVGLIIADRKLSLPKVILFFVITPMWMNFLLRTYAWMVLLENSGLINSFFAALGLPRQQLMYNSTGVLIGLVYNFLPFMILPIYSALSKLDYQLVEASMDLGANPLQVFRRVTLPLSLPGVLTGITMVFMPAVSTFAVSRLLGGTKVTMLGDLIESQFKYNPGFASAISLVMMVLILLSIRLTHLPNREKTGMKGVTG